MSAYPSLVDTIGKTPLVRLEAFEKHLGLKARLFGKCEFFNPQASVKDRIAAAMIEAAEKDGLLKPDTLIVEPTSGNTGIGLAFVCAVKGYRLILTMPESMSLERRKLLTHFGAELVLTPAEKGMKGAIEAADALLAEHKNAYMPQQFSNPANPAIHYKTTGPELYDALGGDLDVLVAGVGTGGTISGAGAYLKEKKPDIKLVAVEPTDSPVIAGGSPGPHKIQGIGAGFIPDNLNRDLLDDVIAVENDAAFDRARLAAKKEGLAVGISSGAALDAAIRVATRKEMHGKNIAVILPSFAERYMSTPLFAEV